MQKIRVGIIGYSGIGKVHAFSYRNLGFYYNDIPAPIELTGVCNRTSKSVEKACQEKGFKIGTTDYMELYRCNKLLHPQ